MYISKIQLENISCFERLDLNLKTNNDILKWIVILGDNGTGKTTLLRSIAIGLCEQTSSAGLLEELYGDLLRDGKKKGLISIELTSSEQPEKVFKIETRLTKSNGTINLEKSVDKHEFKWNDIFVCGYGAARGVIGFEPYREYAAVDAVYSLFNYKSVLQNPEVAISRILLSSKKNIDKTRRELLNSIDKILMLTEGSTNLEKTGFSISGPWGKSKPLGGLGDGHRATMTWICDLLGWAFMYDDKMYLKNIFGIVMIDEIEQHLHAKWQKYILKLLRDQFPKIQFIITTHSPMCAVGTNEFEDNEIRLVLLNQNEGYVEHSEHTPPRGQRADQVLTSYLFGLQTSSDNIIKYNIEKLSNLLSKKHKCPEDENEILMLRDYLNKKLGAGETALEILVAKAVDDVIKNEVRKISFDKQAINFEIKRQLQDLLKD